MCQSVKPCDFLKGPTDSPTAGLLQEADGPNPPQSLSPMCLSVKLCMPTMPRTQMSSVLMQMTSLTS